MYKKRAGTSGIRGALYGTKLMSLLYFRAMHDDDIEEFQLASNIDNIGVFDDICFRAKVKGFDKPVAVFIQAKHRENEKQTLKNDLAIYFDSYLKVRKTFETNNDDLLFNGTFDETECLFVIYTTAKDNLSNDSVTSAFSSKLNSLIYTCGKVETRDQPGGTRSVDMQPGGTHGTAMQLGGTHGTAMQQGGTHGTVIQSHKQEENVEFLCKIAMKEQITSLAERIAYFIYDEENFQMMLSNELVLFYHIILGQKVFKISEIQPNGHRIATFRHDFFDTNDKYLILFKDTLYTEILKKRKIKPTDIKKFLSEFLAEPSDVTKLSKLIGTVITYNNGQLDFDEQSTKEIKPQLHKFVSRSTVKEAVELAAKEILLSRHLKVPAAFGNKDLIISGSNEEIETTLNHLTSRFIDLLDKCKSSDKVVLDESFRDGFLQRNGSITGVIGNIFVLDDNTKLMKITDNWESLGDLAKRLYTKLIDEIHNLHDYKFYFKVEKLPKLSFDCSENEENLARDFLNKLLFYSKQADENGVETSLKVEIEDYQRDHPNYFQVKTDAIFLKYHDEIQKWWMHPKESFYLTRESDLFKKAINNIIEDSLICSINVTYMSKLKQYINYTFTEDAVWSLNLQDHTNSVIITENSVLTVIKVMQHLKKKDLVVFDLEYVIKLPPNDRNTLRTELENINENIFLIFVCDKIRNSRNEKRVLENISNAVHDKKTIVIMNNIKSLEMLQKYFPKTDSIVHDEKNTLVDMSEESQKSILENARVIFQGTEVRLDSIVNDKSKAYVKGVVLNNIIIEETIVVGKTVVNRNYDEIKHMYVDRRVKKTGDDVNVYFKTLLEGEDDVVLVTAEPGMGKSTLLTHLSLKTKEEYPELWIVRINLLEYSKEFNKWKEENTAIDLLETLKLMCQVVLREKLGNKNNVEISLREETGVVCLKNCPGDHWTEFELKLFLQFYDEGKLIFLFDGFDEICPHYTNEVIKCLKTVSSDPRKHRMWVTSRSYNEVKSILQREFRTSYQIENFSYMEMQKYLETFWEYNLRLEELNSAQLENVKNFIEYMSKLEDVKLHGFVMPLHNVYSNAAHYLLSEIKYRRIPLWTYNIHCNDSFYSQIKDHDYMSSFHKDNRDGNPLHLLLAAVFVESSIKSVNITRWDLEVNTYTFYERFLEMKMKTIRFQEKNEVNIYNPDIIITYDKELANFISKHKKLAAYGIFKLHSHRLFSMKDLDDIKDTITLIEKGGEKTGLIYSVANGVPMFILTEYFAVEYVCDCLKNENDSDKQVPWIDFIFNVMFSIENCTNIRNIFDYKIKTDKTLINILEKKDEEIFNLIMEQGRLYSEYIVNMCESYPVDIERRYWALAVAWSEHLHNFLLFFVKILKCYINNSNLNYFLDIVRGSQLLCSAYAYKSDVLIIFVFDVVRKIDETKLTSVLLYNFSFLPHSTISSYVELSSLDIVERIFLDEDCIEAQHISESTSSGFSSGPLTSSKPSQPSTSSLPSRPSTSSLPSRPSTSSLPSRPSTSSLPSRPSTSSLPSQPLTSNLPRRSSTSSLPRQSSASSLTSQPATSRRLSL